MRKIEQEIEPLYLALDDALIDRLSEAQRELIATTIESVDEGSARLANSLSNGGKKGEQEINQLHLKWSEDAIAAWIRRAKQELLATYRLNHNLRQSLIARSARRKPRPPFNAEYLLYLLVRADEREFVIGDLIEGYSQVLRRFDKQRADIWFYKQVAGSLLPLLRRALLKIGAFVWLGRVLQRLIS